MEYEIIRDDEYLKTWIQIEEFSSFIIENRLKEDPCEIEFVFMDTEDVDFPAEHQMNALHYFIENTQAILDVLTKYIYDNREELEEIFSAFDQKNYEGFPDLKSEKEVCKYVDISTIYIHSESLENTAYIGLYGDCTWDIEHAFGVIFHKQRLVDFGDFNTANSFYEENPNFSISEIFGIEPILEVKANLRKLAANVKIADTQKYLELFDWLIKQRAIYGYRSTPVDLTDNEKIALIENMEYLYIGFRGLTELPESLVLLKNLSVLSARSNKLQAIPSCISELTQLRSLDILNNKIAQLPDSFSNLTNIEHLEISMNSFTVFPNCIKEMKKMLLLDASYNEIKVIPDWIGELNQLTDLILSNNQIKRLPQTILKLTNLHILMARNNRFPFFQRLRMKNWLNSNITFEYDKDPDYSMYDED